MRMRWWDWDLGWSCKGRMEQVRPGVGLRYGWGHRMLVSGLVETGLGGEVVLGRGQ